MATTTPVRMLIVDKEATHKQHTRIASPVLFRIELLFKADKIHVSCPPYQFNELLFVRQYYFFAIAAHIRKWPLRSRRYKIWQELYRAFFDHYLFGI